MLNVESISPTLTCLTMNRPPANALTHEMISGLADKFAELGNADQPPAIILTGAGDRFFCAGGDIREVTDNPEVAIPRMHSFHRMLVELEGYKAPALCAVNGYAVGGAMELILNADYVVSSATAQFGFPEINHGLLPAAKGMRKTVERLGRRMAERLLYSGEIIPAERALEIGLVDEVVAAADLQDCAQEKAEAMRSKDMKLFWAIKRTFNDASLMTDDELEQRTVEDMKMYMANAETNSAREKFLKRKAD